MSLKLLLDENVSPRVAVELRQFGFDALHVREVNLKGCEDWQVMDFGRTTGRCLVTLDADFADIRRYPPGAHKGIIRMKLKFAPASLVVSVLLSLLPRLADAPVEDGILVVTDGKRYRLRRPEGLGGMGNL